MRLASEAVAVAAAVTVTVAVAMVCMAGCRVEKWGEKERWRAL